MTEQEWLKLLDIHIFIISRSRYKTIGKKTCSVVPEWVEVIVPEDEVELYRKEIQNPLIVVPDCVEGLGQLRNWVVQGFDENIIVMLDDDIECLYNLSGPKSKRIEDKEEVIQIIINTAVMARDLKTQMFGFFPTDIRKFKGTSPFCLNGWVDGCVGVIGKSLKFRDDKFKVDIDFVLQNLLKNRVIFQDTRYHFNNNRDFNAGGNAKFRTDESFKKSLDTLKEKWGECIKVTNHKNKPSMKLNVERKQHITYEK